MEYYLEIKVLPDPEFKETVLMNALFSKLHRALVTIKNETIGISFCQANEKSLGNTLRLHGTDKELNQLNDLKWLKGLSDYTICSDLQPTPNSTKYRIVKRVQAKSNLERLKRRSIKKGWLTKLEADKKFSNKLAQTLELPYLQLQSSSTGQAFKIFIHQGELLEKPIVGKFNAYGLSNEGTIPWF